MTELTRSEINGLRVGLKAKFPPEFTTHMPAAHAGIDALCDLALSAITAPAAGHAVAQRIDGLTGVMLKNVLEFVCPDGTEEQYEAELSIGRLAEHEDGPGIYSWMTEYPEEGSVRIDVPGAAHPSPAAEGADRLPGFVKPDNDRQVFFYEQDHYYLSNFSAFKVNVFGRTFDSSEAAYHWARFQGTDTSAQSDIRHAHSAHDAFRYAQGNKHRQREDWDSIKVEKMRDILRAKVDQHEYVRRKLLQTANKELIEDSWRDDFWGWGPNRDGKNMLGKLWMEVRAELLPPSLPRLAGWEGRGMSDPMESRSVVETIAAMQHYYLAHMNCWNCNASNSAEIRKGTPKKGYLIECHKCGCTIDMGTSKP